MRAGNRKGMQGMTIVKQLIVGAIKIFFVFMFFGVLVSMLTTWMLASFDWFGIQSGHLSLSQTLFFTKVFPNVMGIAAGIIAAFLLYTAKGKTVFTLYGASACLYVGLAFYDLLRRLLAA